MARNKLNMLKKLLLKQFFMQITNYNADNLFRCSLDNVTTNGAHRSVCSLGPSLGKILQVLHSYRLVY